MNDHPNTAVCGLLLVAVLVFMSFSMKPLPGSEVPVVRARLIELVDDRGKTRASLRIEESGETVFRIMDETGTIRVKIGGSKDGSGLVLLDNDTNPGVHVLSKAEGGTMTLSDKNGKKRHLAP